MAIERRQRLHHFEIMLHNAGKPGGSYYIETYDWDTGANAIVPGSGVLSVAQPIAVNSGDQGEAWSKVRELLDVEAIEILNRVQALADANAAERDEANRLAQAKADEAAKHLQARDAMRATLAGKVEDMERALAAEAEARAVLADVVDHGT